MIHSAFGHRSHGLAERKECMSDRRENPFRTLVAFAPLVFLAHFAEEIPGFVGWFNSQIARGMTDESFWQANIAVLVITVVVAFVVWFGHSTTTVIVAVVWLSFVMGANSVVHVGAALVQRQYVPGLVTALILYLPYFPFVLAYARRRGVSRPGLIAAAGVGAVPMLIQGYLVVFGATRLF